MIIIVSHKIGTVLERKIFHIFRIDDRKINGERACPEPI